MSTFAKYLIIVLSLSFLIGFSIGWNIAARAAGPSSEPLTSAEYIFPLPSVAAKVPLTTTFYDYKFADGYTKIGRSHWDIPVAYGTAIVAPADCIIVETGATERAGAYIKIEWEDENGLTEIMFCHLRNKNGVQYLSGSEVKKGMTIAYSGYLGQNSTGCHVHMECRRNGEFINPNKIFNVKTTILR